MSPLARGRYKTGRTSSLSATGRAPNDEAHVQRRDTGPVMSEATPDLVERWQGAAEAYLARRDLDTTMRFYAPDAVWDGSSAGCGGLRGTPCRGGDHVAHDGTRRD